MDIPATPDNSLVKRGFARLSPEKRREIAQKGGAAVPHEKRAFSQNRDLARHAGRKGGLASTVSVAEAEDAVAPETGRTDPPRDSGRPGSDAWRPEDGSPGGNPARASTPPGAPGTEDGTR